MQKQYKILVCQNDKGEFLRLEPEGVEMSCQAVWTDNIAKATDFSKEQLGGLRDARNLVWYQVNLEYRALPPNAIRYFEVIQDGVIIDVLEQNADTLDVMIALEANTIVDGYKEISEGAYHLWYVDNWKGEKAEADLVLSDEEGSYHLINVHQLG